MAAKVNTPSVGDENVVTIYVEQHHHSGTPSVTVIPSVPSQNASQSIKTDGAESEKSVDHVPRKITYLPSRYTVTPPQRMATRSIGKAKEKPKPSKAKKRKQPAENSDPATDGRKSPRVGKGTHSKGAGKQSKSKSSTSTVSPKDKDVASTSKSSKSQMKSAVTPKTKKSQKKAAVTPRTAKSPTKAAKTPSSDKSPTNSAVTPRNKKSVAKAGSGAKAAGDIRVKFSPTKRKRVSIDPPLLDHDYECDAPDDQELKKKLLKSEEQVKKLLRDRKTLRMRVWRAQCRNEKLMKNILLEQKMHKETQQTLKAIMKGLQLQIATVDPGAI